MTNGRNNSTAMAAAAQGGEPRARDTAMEVQGLLKQYSGFLKDVLPRVAGLTPERLTRIAVTTLRTTPKLLECSTASLMGALIQAAQLGLEPDPRLGRAYLVPYKGEATLQIGWRGYIELVRRSGEVSTVEAHVVHARDVFTLRYGADATLSHSPCLEAGPGEVVGVYAFARYKDQSWQAEYMSRAQVERIRQASPGRDKDPWKLHWEEMARKTAIRRLAKRLPVSVDMAEAESVDGRAVRGMTTAGPIVDHSDPPSLGIIDVKADDAGDQPEPATLSGAKLIEAINAEAARVGRDEFGRQCTECDTDPKDWHTRGDDSMRLLLSALQAA